MIVAKERLSPVAYSRPLGNLQVRYPFLLSSSPDEKVLPVRNLHAPETGHASIGKLMRQSHKLI